jgi:hypothetical protein
VTKAGESKPAQKYASSNAAFERLVVLLDEPFAIMGATTVDEEG